MNRTKTNKQDRRRPKVMIDTEHLKMHLQRTINPGKPDIDRTAFTKTEDEKISLKEAKKQWKESIRKES